MASTMSSQPDTSNVDFECSICLHFFTPPLLDKEFAPLLLDCGHTLCRSCMVAISQHKTHVQCPACRLCTSICNGGVDALKQNEAIVGLMERQQAQQQQHQHQQLAICGECESKSVEVFCQVCKSELCAECFGTLHAGKTMKTHTFTTLTSKKDTWCDEHNEEIKMFCHTCSKGVCNCCIASGGCRVHQARLIGEEDAAQFAALLQAATSLRSFDCPLAQQVQTVSDLAQEHSEVSVQVIEAIKLAIGAVRKQLDSVEQDVVGHVMRHSEARLKALDLHKHHLLMLQSSTTALTTTATAMTSAHTPSPLTPHTAQDKASSVQFVREAVSCVGQVRSLVEQCRLLTDVPGVAGTGGANGASGVGKLLASPVPFHTPAILTATQQLESKCSPHMTAIDRQLQHLVSVVTFDAQHVLDALDWNMDECVGCEGGTSISLSWTGADCDEHEFVVRMVLDNSLEIPDFQSSENMLVVCQGKETTCVVRGLRALHEYSFRLSALCYGSIVVECGTVCRITTTDCALPVFDVLDPGVVALTSGLNQSITRAAHADGSYRLAMSSLIRTRDTFWWKLKIVNLGSMDFMAGIISSNTAGQFSGSSKTSFVWCCVGVGRHDGIRVQQADWQAGWQSGDEAVFRLDVVSNTLCMRHMRTPNVMHSMSITPNLDWRIHVCLPLQSDAVDLMPAANQDRF
eukprot:c8083_g1_i1.p1 GENE.c8083_g1_i1~~c8083_g1_i1.p1  ORF type:complete len:694 (-),score=198.55 c8083_g1_i1:75-2132(-)